MLEGWRARARGLKRDTLTLYFAWRDPRTPLAARVLAAGVAGYALSPIDLIPDFVPVLGLLDDLILVPLGIALVVKMLPPAVLADARGRAAAASATPTSRSAAIAIVIIWVVAIAVVATFVSRALFPRI